MNFKEVIKQYLDKRAVEDSLFAVTYKKENKNITECCNYIMQEARKKGNAVCMSDDEVFSLAVHYYDEDNIKNVAKISNSRVSTVNSMSAADKEKAKQKMLEHYEKEEQQKKAKKAAARAEQRKVFEKRQLSLFE